MECLSDYRIFHSIGIEYSIMESRYYFGVRICSGKIDAASDDHPRS